MGFNNKFQNKLVKIEINKPIKILFLTKNYLILSTYYKNVLVKIIIENH